MSRISIDDEDVVNALCAYKEELEAGGRPNREPLLERFPEIAEDVTACLDGLDLVHNVAPQLKQEVGDGEMAEVAPLGDFRIIREIGRGGMGVVYEAEQMSLGRHVALKVLPFAAVLDDRYLRRFKNEAQAAALLHHTNIVPVHAIGSDRGVHYYAMQYIEGPTVAGLVDELLTLRQHDGNGRSSSRALRAITKERTTESPAFCRAVARLGVQAAEGLEYAHESGVVHRDIKPPNLIVDPKGHLWITDFGLASTRNDTGLTMTGDLVGTLRYMSPEQAMAGRVLVDHRTDIYSLGVSLYELVTLEQAFPGEEAQGVMQSIAVREPVKPRALNPATPAELETILLKAMSKDPADRYATAQELADDLRRFVEDRPIAARRPSLRKRALQWSRRHRSVVWAAAVVLLLFTVGLAVSTLLIDRERRIAVERAADAEASYEVARGIVDDVLVRLSEHIRDEPHLTELRRDLLERAVSLYRDFLERGGNEPGLRFEAAHAHERLGSALQSLGRHEGSLRAYDQAIALGSKLPPQPAVEQILADAHLGRGRTLYDLGKLEACLAASATAARLWHALAMEDREYALFRVVDAHSFLGDVCRLAGRPQDSLAWIESGIEFGRQGLEQGSDSAYHASFVAEIGELHYLAGLARRDLGDYAQAERDYREAITHLRRACEHAPHRSGHRAKLGSGYLNLGNLIQRDPQRADEALAASQKGVEYYDALVREFPRAPSFRQEAANGYNVLGNGLARAGRKAEGLAALEKAVSLAEGLVEEFPGVVIHASRLANALNDLALELPESESVRRIECFERALRLRREILKKLPESPHERRCLVKHCWMLGWHLPVTESDEKARAILREGICVARGLIADFPDSAADARLLGGLFATAADRQMQRSDPAAARASLAQSVSSQEQAFRLAPENAQYSHQLSATLLSLGNVLSRLGEAEEAANAYRSSVAVHEALARTDPDAVRPPAVAEVKNALAWLLATCSDPKVRDAPAAVELATQAVELAGGEGHIWNTLGVARYRAGDFRGAVEALGRSMKLSKDEQGSAHDWLFLAMAWHRIGEGSKARPYYDRAVAWIKEHAPDDAELAAIRAEATEVLEAND